MSVTSAGDTIVQEITIKARAERIFDALTDPGQRVKWWGAEGRFQATHMESDLRPGGAWLMRGVGMGGRPFTIRGVYRAIERPRLLVFTWRPDWQEDASESLVRLDLKERGGITMVRLTHSGLASRSARESHQGWPQILARLKADVEGEGVVDHPILRFWGVRYQVADVNRSIAFYTRHLGFTLDQQRPPAFGQVSLGILKLVLSGPGTSGARPMPDGRSQEPGGWNRVMLLVEDLPARIEAMKKAGLRFRNEIEVGPGGRQIQLEDPDGNPIELFEPAR